MNLQTELRDVLAVIAFKSIVVLDLIYVVKVNGYLIKMIRIRNIDLISLKTKSSNYH